MKFQNTNKQVNQITTTQLIPIHETEIASEKDNHELETLFWGTKNIFRNIKKIGFLLLFLLMIVLIRYTSLYKKNCEGNGLTYGHENTWTKNFNDIIVTLGYYFIYPF